MARVFFVTGSAGLVGYLQHRSTLRKAIGDSSNVPDASSRRSVGMSRQPCRGTSFVSSSRHDITVHATSGFLRCRCEKTRTCTGRHRIHFLLQEHHNHGRLSSFS
jgi:hypothetical protein